MHASPGRQYAPKFTLTRRFGRQSRPVKRKVLPSGASRGSTDMQKRSQSGDWPVL